MTLTEFLVARYDDIEQVARAAEPGPWRWVDPGRPKVKLALVGEDGSIILLAAQADAYLSTFDAEHITFHNPAYVLDDLAAKRQTVALHTPAGRLYEDGPFYCSECGSGEPYEYPTEWPCRTLRLLALPFASHADYDESWRPA